MSEPIGIEVTTQAINDTLTNLSPGQSRNLPGLLNGVAVSVQRIDDRFGATLTILPGSSRSAGVASQAPLSSCVAANVLGGAVFALGAAAIGVLLAVNPEVDVFVIAGITIARAALVEAQALLEGGAAIEALVAFFAQFVC